MKLMHHRKGSESGRKLSGFFREAVFGLGDGMVSTLGAITGIAIGTGSRFVVLLSGLVVIAVESLSMAAGTYLSSKSEREILERYLEEEKWEIENKFEKEKKELRDIYRKKGFNKKELDMIVSRISKNKEVMLEEMAHHELKIIPENLEKPRGNAFIMGFSYVVGGLVPLSSYFLASLDLALKVSIGLTVLALFAVGAYKTRITGKSPWVSGFEMASVSLAAALLGYVIARVAGVYLAPFI